MTWNLTSEETTNAVLKHNGFIMGQRSGSHREESARNSFISVGSGQNKQQDVYLEFMKGVVSVSAV